MVNSMISEVCERVGYSEIINHSGMDISIEGTVCHNTRRGTAGSKESLNELRNSVLKSIDGMNLADKSEKQHRIEVMKSRSRFVHGTDSWLEGTTVSGRLPILSISRDGEQLARWNPRDGRFAFSKKALPLLHESGCFPSVSILENHDWKETYFQQIWSQYPVKLDWGKKLWLLKTGY